MTIGICGESSGRVQSVMRAFTMLACAVAGLSGCAGPADVRKAPPPLSPEARLKIDAARSDYVACLDAASRYMDDTVSPLESLTVRVAPLCYPQFARFAEVLAANEGDASGVFEKRGDALQVEMAADSLRRVRESGKVATKD